MNETDADPYLDWDAAYVLGALSPQERREFEEHKTDCGRCSAAVQELAGMPGLLAAADVEQIESVDCDETAHVSPVVLTGLLATAQRRRRQRRVLLPVAAFIAAAATVAALLVGGVIGPAPHRDGVVSLALAPVRTKALKVSVRLAPEPWGTRIDVSCRYREDGAEPSGSSAGASPGAAARTPAFSYVLLVTDRAGMNHVAATFGDVPGKTVWPVGSVSVPLNDIAKIQLTTDKHVPLAELVR